MSPVLSPATSSLHFKVFKYFTLNYLTHSSEASGVPAVLKVLQEASLLLEVVVPPSGGTGLLLAPLNFRNFVGNFQTFLDIILDDFCAYIRHVLT